MINFLDIEASGLGSASFPVEIAWVDEAGAGESHLTRPAPGWTQWSAKAEALHGITRAMLAAEGADHREVAHRAAAAFARATRVISDAPEWDQHWLDQLAQAAGLARIGRVSNFEETAGHDAGGLHGENVVPRHPEARQHRAAQDAEALRQRFLLARKAEAWRCSSRIG